MAKTKSNGTHASARLFNNRSQAAAMLADSGVVVSKTGGAYRDPASIIRSSRAQEQLKAIAIIRERNRK
ncbi:MAG: hypothetical protein Q7W55_02125 [Pseudohongiella sp.]|nr:hypothetical protein [Pseudohongiella sp.]